MYQPCVQVSQKMVVLHNLLAETGAKIVFREPLPTGRGARDNPENHRPEPLPSQVCPEEVPVFRIAQHQRPAGEGVHEARTLAVQVAERTFHQVCWRPRPTVSVARSKPTWLAPLVPGLPSGAVARRADSIARRRHSVKRAPEENLLSPTSR